MMSRMDALDSFIGKIQTQILDPIITLLALAAFAVFAWGVVEFILGADNQEKRSTGQKHMFWGVIGLVIMFGAKVLTKIIGSIVGVEVEGI